MKHLDKFEDFSYHSEISEKNKKKSHIKEPSEIEKHKCYKCRTDLAKPAYQNLSGEIPRLF